MTQYQRVRLLLGLAILACIGIFHFTAITLHIPQEPGYTASLVTQPDSVVDFIIVMVAFFVCLVVGSLIAGTVRVEAGLLAACCGLATLSWMGGPLRTVLQSVDGPGVFPGLAVELAVLYAMLIGGWLLLDRARRARWLSDLDEETIDTDIGLDARLLATATQIVTMAVVMLLLARSDEKKQVLAAVGISCFVATFVAASAFPLACSLWYLPGPCVVGILGYLLAWFSPDGFAIGQVRGLAILARPLPLDYASLGPAAALLAVWMVRTHKSELAASQSLAEMPVKP